LYAGSKTVVQTLWSVPDAESAYLSGEFLGNLKQGMSKAQALRTAKLSLLGKEGQKRFDSRVQNPFYWSGIILIGEPSGMEELDKKSTLWVGVPMLIILLLFLLLYTIRRCFMS